MVVGLALSVALGAMKTLRWNGYTPTPVETVTDTATDAATAAAGKKHSTPFSKQ
jgi:hypothetical protein